MTKSVFRSTFAHGFAYTVCVFLLAGGMVLGQETVSGVADGGVSTSPPARWQSTPQPNRAFSVNEGWGLPWRTPLWQERAERLPMPPRSNSALPRAMTTVSPTGDMLQVQQEIPPIDVEAPRVTPGTGTPFPGPSGEGEGGTPNLFGGRNIIPWSSDAIRSDSDRVGPYNQPAWTTQRPFTSVRTYVLPPGQMQVEQWYRPRWKKGGSREDRILEELAIGLPNRFQLDVYERWNIEQDDTGHYNANHEGVQIELRWALADWDVIPLNPTLYAEWVQRGSREDEPDKYELKLLLAQELFDGRLFFAGNAILEQEVGGEKETELGYSQALATTIIERKLLAGIEMWYRSTTVHGDRSNPSHEFLIGPTVQWRPTNRTFLDITPLFGTSKDAPRVEMFIVFGYQFGNRAGPSFGGITPSSLGQ